MEVDNCEKRAGVVEAPSVSFPTGHPLEGTTVSRDNKTGKIFNVCNIFLLFCMKMIRKYLFILLPVKSKNSYVHVYSN